jgi:Ca2+-binding EF-hand superfamily protein
MRSFVKSNCLKRAVLSAVAPIATVEKVSHWATQFEALDKQKDGMVSVANLTDQLMRYSDADEQEARHICECLAAIDGGEMVSYSAFLATCLSERTALSDDDIEELFARLDEDGDGLIHVEDLKDKFGSLVDPDEWERVEGDLEDKKFSLTDFRWMLVKPRLGQTSADMKKEMWFYSDKDRRADSARVRHAQPSEGNQEQVCAAARRENMSWRLFWRERHGRAASSGSNTPAGTPDRSPERRIANVVMGDYPSERAFASPSRGTSQTQATLGGVSAVSGAVSDAGDLLKELDSENYLRDDWAVATREAKDGDVEAARKENMAWRKFHFDQKSDFKIEMNTEDARVIDASPA